MRGKVGKNMEGMKIQITKARKQHNVLSPSFKLCVVTIK